MSAAAAAALYPSFDTSPLPPVNYDYGRPPAHDPGVGLAQGMASMQLQQPSLMDSAAQQPPPSSYDLLQQLESPQPGLSLGPQPMEVSSVLRMNIFQWFDRVHTANFVK